MNSILENNKQQIIELCRQYHVRELYAFGSVVRDDFTTESDIDLLANFKITPVIDNTNELSIYFDNMDELSSKFSLLFNRSVDLLTENNIRNKYLKQIINTEKKLIYAEA